MPDMNAPQLTPEDINAIKQAQAQAEGGEQPDMGGMPPEAGYTNPATMGQPQQPQANPEDEIEFAKKILGIEEIQKQALQAQQELQKIKEERTKQVVLSKYPNVPADLVEKEIEKVSQVNPQLAEAMKTNPDLMEMAVKSVLASIKPNEQPDNITKGEGANDTTPQDELAEKVRKGEADPITLGDYILNLSKSK
jgi:hypothetical protein